MVFNRGGGGDPQRTQNGSIVTKLNSFKTPARKGARGQGPPKQQNNYKNALVDDGGATRKTNVGVVNDRTQNLLKSLGMNAKVGGGRGNNNNNNINFSGETPLRKSN